MIEFKAIRNTAWMPTLPGLLWPVAALLLLLLAWPGLGGPFLFDDMPNLQHLALLNGQLDWPSLGHYLASFTGNPGRPLAALSFLINDLDWPSSPWGFKYTNLMLHVLAGLMAFGLSRTLVLAHALDDSPAVARRAAWCALLASALWMLHPIQVSPVFLVVQRMTILSALFVMAGLWAYVALLRRARTTPGVFVALAVLAFFTLLAFLCKENGALAPLYAWVLHATVLRPLLPGGATQRRSHMLARWAIPAAALLPFAWVLASYDPVRSFTLREFTAYERLLTQPRVLVDYLQAILMPRIGGGGSIFHDDYVFSTGWLSPTATLFCALVVAALLVAGWVLRQRWPWAALAVLWFFAGHAAESSFLALELYFEHRNYLPLLGITMGAAYAVTHAPERWRRVAVILLLAWLAIAAFITHAQARVWGNEVLLSEVWAAEHPDSPRAVQVRAKVRYERGDIIGARQVFQDAAENKRGDSNAWLYLLLLDCYGDNATTPQAIARARAQLASQFPDYGTFDQLSLLRERATKQNCRGFELPQWLALSEGLLENPRRHALYLLHYQRALAYQSLRDLDGTVHEFETAYTIAPQASYAWLLATTFSSAGLHDEALRWAIIARDTPMPRLKAWLTRRADHDTAMIAAIRRARDAAAGSTQAAGKPDALNPAEL